MLNPNFTFRAFLSHKYNSPDINLFFFQLFKGVAKIHFEVDKGEGDTNVTRLERMIRDCDAFIGIYSINEEYAITQITNEKLVEEFAYFKLEIDIAMRLRKPMILFVDKRFGRLVSASASTTICSYDHRELFSDDARRTEKFIKEIQNFCGYLEELQPFHLHSRRDLETIHFFIPDHIKAGRIYTETIIENCRQQLNDIFLNRVVELVKPPFRINGEMFRRVESSDFIVADLNDESGMIPFLHGNGIPMIRLQNKEMQDGDEGKVAKTLFGDQTKGYPKDVIRWNAAEDLSKELLTRLNRINGETTLIVNYDDAITYFKKAIRREEEVFVSFSSSNKDAALKIIGKLKKRFRTIYYYTDDNKTISPGKEWQPELEKRISESKAGIILMSPRYFESEHCKTETEMMLALESPGKYVILPVRVEETVIPEKLKKLEYRKYDAPGNPQLIVDDLEELLNELQQRKINLNKKRQQGIDGPLKILFAAAVPDDLHRLSSEFDEINERLKTSIQKKEIELLSPIMETNYDRLQTHLKEDRPNVLHYSGHGIKPGIFLKDKNGASQFVNNEQLEIIFKGRSGHLSLIFFNSCFSAEQAKVISSQGIYVLGFKDEIENSIAKAFAEKFYLGFSVQEAPVEVERAIYIGCTNFALDYTDEASLVSLWANGREIDYNTLNNN